jgi:hypothetical protein
MEYIKKSIRYTRKTCECGKGSIVEIFTKKYGKSNGIVGPGHHTPSWVSSDGFGCNNCGRKYGEPIFTKTKATLQVEFELSLLKGTLKKKVTIKDLPIKTELVEGKKTYITFGNNQKLEGHVLVPKQVKPKSVPKELTLLTIGTEVYIIPSKEHDHRNPFVTIQLSIKKDSKTFIVSRSCIS